jgi:hypothetical protein
MLIKILFLITVITLIIFASISVGYGMIGHSENTSVNSSEKHEDYAQGKVEIFILPPDVEDKNTGK